MHTCSQTIESIYCGGIMFASALCVPLFAAQLSASGNPDVLLSSSRSVDEKVGHPLSWDAMEKKYVAKLGESIVEMEFSVLNRGSQEVIIARIQPSCGCTMVDAPVLPWRLAPGDSGKLGVKVNLAGKRGEVMKSILVDSTAGKQTLHVNVSISEAGLSERERNQMLARADRQAVFRGECAQCHAAPLIGKLGAELFEAACGTCHTSTQRASFVPDLSKPTAPRDAAYWISIIAEGRTGTLMPAFAQANGGPLTVAQIRSLMNYCLRELSPGDRK